MSNTNNDLKSMADDVIDKADITVMTERNQPLIATVYLPKVLDSDVINKTTNNTF